MNVKELKNSLIKYKNYKPIAEFGLVKMEENMLVTLFELLRATEKDRRNNADFKSFDVKHQTLFKKEEYSEDYIDCSVENLKNYKINNLILYILEKAHNNWIIGNEKKLNSNTIKNANKFVPFKMLEWKDVFKYFQILQPVLNCLDVEHDKEEVKNQHLRNRLGFLFRNLIYSKESLIKNLERPEDFFPQFSNLKNETGEKIIDKLKKKSIINQIADQVEEKSDLNLANQLKEVLFMDKNKIGSYYMHAPVNRNGKYHFEDYVTQRKFGFRKQAYPRLKSPITEGLLEIAKQDVILVKNLKSYNYDYISLSTKRTYFKDNVQFVPYEKCSDEQKKIIDKREKKRERLLEKLCGKDDKKNKELGLITFVLLANEKTNSNEKLNRNSFSRPDNIEIVQIEMTQEEVLQLGYLPEELGWEKKKKALIISDRSILIKGDNKIDIEKNNVDDTHKNECDKILDFHEKMKVRDNGSINEKNKITNGNMAKNNRELKNNEKDIGD